MPSSSLLTRLLSVLALAALAACSGGTPMREAATPPAATIPVDALRADFDALYAGLQAAHFDLYARRDRADYDRRFFELRAGIDHPLTAAQARVLFQRLAAYGNVAHARVDPPSDAWEAFRTGGGKSFPLALRVDGDVVRVAGGSGGLDGIALGDRIESIDGEPALRWLGRVRALVSADSDYMAWAQVETRLPLLAWLEFGEVERFDVVVTGADGRERGVSVPALDRAGFEAAAKAAPPRFELDWNAREARMLDGGIAYLRPGPFYDNRPQAPHPWDATDFHRFIDAAFADFIASGATRLLIDLRANPGGDNSFSDHLVAWFADRPFRFTHSFVIRVSDAAVAANRERLEAQGGNADSTSARLAAAYANQPAGSLVPYDVPEVAPRPPPRFDGEVYVLIDRHTYSNSVLVAAIVQDYGFGTLLGEETSDLASTYGAMESFTLPNSGIVVGFPKARILRPSGDDAPRGVVPDIAIAAPPPGSTADEVLARAVAIIATGAGRAPAARPRMARADQKVSTNSATMPSSRTARSTSPCTARATASLVACTSMSWKSLVPMSSGSDSELESSRRCEPLSPTSSTRSTSSIDSTRLSTACTCALGPVRRKRTVRMRRPQCGVATPASSESRAASLLDCAMLLSATKPTIRCSRSTTGRRRTPSSAILRATSATSWSS